jgi:hypothetical protein
MIARSNRVFWPVTALLSSFGGCSLQLPPRFFAKSFLLEGFPAGAGHSMLAQISHKVWLWRVPLLALLEIPI